jgi:hypothetical protein
MGNCCTSHAVHPIITRAAPPTYAPEAWAVTFVEKVIANNLTSQITKRVASASEEDDDTTHWVSTTIDLQKPYSKAELGQIVLAIAKYYESSEDQVQVILVTTPKPKLTVRVLIAFSK